MQKNMNDSDKAKPLSAEEFFTKLFEAFPEVMQGIADEFETEEDFRKWLESEVQENEN